ncbi:uncharacterized protein LOC108606913 [Drosophila busckii]|uniref:uncharacterized protein LOC108606913 n=1 Tax=Drosophila busckii TaxID=30019 RepID=UPI00083EF31B|nr:uncharacterized protein LOC108606913 [Drosophila busckii]
MSNELTPEELAEMQKTNATGVQIENFEWPLVTGAIFYDICAVLSRILLIGLTLVVATKCLQLKLARSAEHAFFCTLGLMLCLGEALLHTRHRMLAHATFGLLALNFGCVGVALKSWYKRKHHRPHMRSKHAVFGLAGLLLMLVCFFTGLVMLLAEIRRQILIVVALAHRCCGLCGFALLMASQVYSYNTGFMRRNWHESTIRMLKFVTMFASLTTTCYQLSTFIADVVDIIPKNLFDNIKITHKA